VSEIWTDLEMQIGIKLKPCPFCGGFEMKSYNPHPTALTITCVKCGADGPWIGTNQPPIMVAREAATAWNTRKEAN
jgi:Lar family restriction alleviation protein